MLQRLVPTAYLCMLLVLLQGVAAVEAIDFQGTPASMLIAAATLLQPALLAWSAPSQSRRAVLQRRLPVGVDPLHAEPAAEPRADQPEEVLAKERLRLEPIHVPEAVGRPAASEAPSRALHLEQHLGLRVDGQKVIVDLDPSGGGSPSHSECTATAAGT